MESKIYSQLVTALKELSLEGSSFIRLTTPNPEFGDYSTNIALILGKTLGRQPTELAQTIVEKIKTFDQEQLFESIDIKNGFINFKINKKQISHYLISGNNIVIPQVDKNNKRVIFEYSSPNTNKPLHIGHTRNDVYGLACVRLLQAIGYDVITCEIINDRGIHIMKSLLMYMKYGNGQTPESVGMKPDHFVGKYYSLFAEEAAKSAESEKKLTEEAQELLRKWESNDSVVRSVWQQMNQWFYKGVIETYKREGSYFDQVDFESDIYNKGRDLVLSGVQKGIFQKESDGSISVDLADQGLDKKYLLRSDGTTIYITQDLYLWSKRAEAHEPAMAIVTTSSEQSYHFQVLKKLFELLQFPWASSFHHLPYEHVYLGHDKMSSRSGNTITADALLELIKSKIKTTMADLKKTKVAASDDELVEKVAFGAIKYGYLKYEPKTRIFFDPETTITLNGNTGPYIQYTYSRICGILRKADQQLSTEIDSLSSNEEIAIMRHLLHYPEKIIEAANTFKPNVVCEYLYQLASKVNAFYNAIPVLTAESDAVRDQRLMLLQISANTLHHGLTILGIESPEEM